MTQINIVQGVPTQQELEQIQNGIKPFRTFNFKLSDGRNVDFALRSLNSVQALTYGGWSMTGYLDQQLVSGYLNTRQNAGYLIIKE